MDDRTPCLVPGCRRPAAEAASAAASILLGAGTGWMRSLRASGTACALALSFRAYSGTMADQIKDAKAIWGIWE